MSVNKVGQLLTSGYHTEGSNQRYYAAYELNNQRNSNNDSIVHYAYAYTCVEFYQEYLQSKFKYCDVVITNRFTMDSTKFTIDFSKTDYYNDDTFVNVEDLQDDNKTNAHFVSSTEVKYLQVFAHDLGSSSRKNYVRLYLSMYDFMYGDVCVQFYDSDKDQYCAPVIVQFTNAPTVFTANVYKWRPNFTTHDVEDYDNIFTSSFGSRYQPGNVDIQDQGRTDVLTGRSFNAEYYNDFMKSDRLITNGMSDPVKHSNNEVSISGHPVYMVEYRTFVPSAFSEMFGINHSPTVVSFSAKNNGKGYLTSAVDDWQAMNTDKLDLRLYTQENESFLDTNYQMTAAKYRDEAPGKIGGIKRVFVAHLTAASGDGRPEDSWFRDHTRACADFALSGIDPYWMSDDKV